MSSSTPSAAASPVLPQPPPFRRPWLVYSIATVSTLLLLVTLGFLFYNRARLENLQVQAWARFAFAFWTVAPPIWFWYEYHYQWCTVHDSKRTDLLERYKLSLETSSKIWLAVVTLLGAFCWAGLDAKAKAATFEQVAAMKRVLTEMKTASDEVRKSSSNTGETLSQMAAKMKEMEYQACPTDFGEAFIRLAWACDKAAQVLKSHPDKLTLVLDMGLRLLSGERDAGATKINQDLQAVNDEMIHWQAELDALCARYGVRAETK